jgi:hypothetical protein
MHGTQNLIGLTLILKRVEFFAKFVDKNGVDQPLPLYAVLTLGSQHFKTMERMQSMGV